MEIINWIISASVRNRLFVLIGVVVFVGVGVVSFGNMTFDAFPDLTNVQVQVLTATPGMGASEVEQLVTVPVERSLGGVPGLTQLRSMSRTGISAITAVFEDGTDRWLARQLVKERLDLARSEIPAEAGTPELAPPTTGLGEVYQFTVSSDRMRLPDLYRLFQRDIAPRLRTVPGVVEVNAWGGGAPELHVLVDPFALAARGIPVTDLHDRLAETVGLRAGGAIVGATEQEVVRAVANPTTPADLEATVLRPGSGAGAPVRLSDVARVVEGGALTVGLGSGDGKGEALFVMVQLLADADARRVVAAVTERVAEIVQSLPEGVSLEPIYDREKLVGSTLHTVLKSLVEGGLMVVFVLLLLLGDLRAGLLVASVIPMSMLGAFVGLNLLGYSGNLMSLGAIDFGLIVDGTIVVAESIVALTLARDGTFGEQVAERARRVAKPVFFAVAILILVYTPVLMMWGTEGKLFRPMALTVLLALGTALALTFTYVPAMASLVIRPRGEHQTRIITWLLRLYEPALRHGVRHPWLVAGGAAAILAVSVGLAGNMGVEFVPRLEEGDLVIQTERLPSINPQEALREVTRIERLVREVPEVQRIAGRTGSPAVATDPMGLEQADILVQLRPRDEWRPGLTRDALVGEIAGHLVRSAPGAAFTFTQPIEMRFNELLEGITSDVGVQIFGPDTDELMRLGQRIADALDGVPGAADVAAPAIEGVPRLDVILEEERLARFGLSASELLATVADVQRGTAIGAVTRGEFRDDVVVRLAVPKGVALEEVPIVLANGVAVPLGEVARVERVEGPAKIDRQAGSRRVIVKANVRGRDVGGYVQEAQEAVAAVPLPKGYWLSWSGKYEQLKTASARMAMIVPAVLFLIVGLLYLVFASWRAALLIFANVPVAVSGGLLLLWLRDMPISMSAVVGFIALFGIAVMNGIVLLSRTRELQATRTALQAATEGARERFRPVLMTAAVAGIGFLPMALATGVGAEVQRPLATVVIGGLVTATVLTLVVLPALYAKLFAYADRARTEAEV
ncbi:MAG: CusA/CzcA family heavy metal efflux RND transporter [Deltaproteobacteria bacterium HGW-Deltaproteobacteria-14]|jgi:cobalt-zinc-cadmium resistance protein CzcA|nr:MAG: CusA/CzcA family heavy metal efflux RND transporter [Deltaproteobacteria bacterium HGW-Deltaproteobacteria-14]